MMIELLKSVVAKSVAATMTQAGGAVGANGPVVFTSTGDKFVLTAVAPVKLLKWGFLADAVALVTGGSNLVLQLAFCPTAGSATGRVAIDTLTVTDPNSAFVLGTGAYRDPFTASVASTAIASEPSGAGPLGSTPGQTNIGATQYILSVGQQWVVQVLTAATTSGQGSIFIEYELLPISKPSGYGTTDAGTVSLTEKYTRVAS